MIKEKTLNDILKLLKYSKNNQRLNQYKLEKLLGNQYEEFENFLLDNNIVTSKLKNINKDLNYEKISEIIKQFFETDIKENNVKFEENSKIVEKDEEVIDLKEDYNEIVNDTDFLSDENDKKESEIEIKSDFWMSLDMNFEEEIDNKKENIEIQNIKEKNIKEDEKEEENNSFDIENNEVNDEKIEEVIEMEERIPFENLEESEILSILNNREIITNFIMQKIKENYENWKDIKESIIDTYNSLSLYELWIDKENVTKENKDDLLNEIIGYVFNWEEIPMKKSENLKNEEIEEKTEVEELDDLLGEDEFEIEDELNLEENIEKEIETEKNVEKEEQIEKDTSEINSFIDNEFEVQEDIETKEEINNENKIKDNNFELNDLDWLEELNHDFLNEIENKEEENIEKNQIKDKKQIKFNITYIFYPISLVIWTWLWYLLASIIV